MTGQRIPDEIRAAAEARRTAREARNWAEADRLRAGIEAAGWKVVDRGTHFRLTPAHPPDVADAGRTRYGRSGSVPSRLDEAPVGLASVVVVADGWADDLARTLGGLNASAAAGTQTIVVVADDVEVANAAEAPHADVVRTTEPLGHAAMLNAGIRRAAAPVIILLDTSVEPTGDFVAPLVAVFDEPTVAVAGPWGFRSTDLRRFEDAEAGDADAIGLYCLAFRRDDYARRGPLDEKFRFYRNLDIWWSFVLRDEGEGRGARRAIVVPGLPLTRHEHRGWTSVPPEERDRLSKRNFYRVLDRFGSRRDLLTSPS